MSKGTTNRAVRISDDLWTRSLAKAAERGEVLAEVIRRALELYADDRHVQPSDPYDAAGSAHIMSCPECAARFGWFPTADRPS